MISAIIVNYRAAALAVRAARSVLDAAVGEPLELIVVDNSESAAEAEQLRAALAKRAEIIVNERNVGFGQACNQAYARAHGDAILLLNPDARLLPGALGTLRAFLNEHRQAGAVGPRVYWDDARAGLLPPNLDMSPRAVLLRELCGRVGGTLSWLISLRQRRAARRYWRATRPRRMSDLSGGHVLLRREAIERSGGLFDSRFFLYFEDTDLFLRLRRAGYALYFVPAAEVVHEFGACARELSGWKQDRMSEAAAEFYAKHYSTSVVLRVARWLGARTTPRWRPQMEVLGPVPVPPVLPVPGPWRDGWLLEWSANACFLPAAGQFGHGAVAEVPESIWAVLPPGPLFLRLGAARRFRVPARIWRFEKAAV